MRQSQEVGLKSLNVALSVNRYAQRRGVEFVFAQIFQCQGVGMSCYARTCDGLKELP